MARLTIGPETFLSSSSGSRFIPLGQRLETEEDKIALQDKINGFHGMHPKIWGTLGKADNDTEIGWSGELNYSQIGNLESEGLTVEEIDHIYNMNPLVNRENTRVIERYINIDNVNFPEINQIYSLRDLPKLRLTLFLNPDEGALVFFHHFKGSRRNEKESDLEYILPEATPEYTTNRDRLTYYFHLLPKRKFVENNDGTYSFGRQCNATSVLKILVFKRLESERDSYYIVQKAIERIRLHRRYKIVKYNALSNDFDDCQNPQSELRSNAKTLLLIHGTFSSTKGSFGGLLETEHAPTKWLQQKSLQYEQIIGFNHSTIMHNADDNLRHFRELLQGIQFTDKPLDVVTFSRGGLVGKQLICGLSNEFFPVRKAALVSCANGVGYFTAAQQLGLLFRYLKKSPYVPDVEMGCIISLFAQHSAKFFLSRPGAMQMTIGDPSLDSILNALPAPQNKTVQFYAISGRWTKNVGKDSNLLKRIGQRGANILTIPILGTPNDFVVNTSRQQLLPPGYESVCPPLACTHTSFFTGRRSANKIRNELDAFFL